ncbi:hypothetical protein PAMC26577_17380 [Caballeronia sordidicola]|nr:hypothetical protein PAMC26577_17380 [Caballeronia sordidicola]
MIIRVSLASSMSASGAYRPLIDLERTALRPIIEAARTRQNW